MSGIDFREVIADTPNKFSEGAEGDQLNRGDRERAGFLVSLYALSVINGQLKGKEILLSPEQELYIGRGAEQDIVLKEDLVSRRHAKLVIFRDSILLEDLHSTNGTSVNEQPISGPCQLQEGDLITVGSCHMRLQRASTEADGNENTVPTQSNWGGMGHGGSSSVGTSTVMSQPAPSVAAPPSPPPPNTQRSRRIETGQLHGAEQLTQLLYRLIDELHDGALILTDVEEREGNLYFRRGEIYFVALEDPVTMAPSPAPREALAALFSWSQCRYKVKPMSALPTFSHALRGESRALVQELSALSSERGRLYQQLPAADRPLQPLSPLEAPLSALGRDELDFFQLCLNRYPLQAAAQHHPLGELKALRIALTLIDRGYLYPN